MPRLFYLPLVEPGVLLSLKAANRREPALKAGSLLFFIVIRRQGVRLFRMAGIGGHQSVDNANHFHIVKRLRQSAVPPNPAESFPH